MTGASEYAASRDGDGGAVVVALVTVFVISLVLLKVIPSPGSLDRLADPPAGPDRVPAGPITRAYPEGCAVSAATVERLVPEPRMAKDGHRGECAWSSVSDDRRSSRYLSVRFTLSLGTRTMRYPGTAAGRAPLAGAMKSFGPKWSDVPGKAVTGLGDEALAQFSPSNGVTVVTRVGNANVVVQYRDIRLPLPEETAREGAFAAASEVVAGLGAGTSAHPAIAPAAGRAPAREIPDLCASVSERTLHRLVKGDNVEPRSGNGDLHIKDAKRRDCSWTSMEHELKVSAAAVPGTELFDGTWLATREYRMRHDDARAEEPLSVHDKKYFHAVTGLGDQAFAAHVPGVVPGMIVFRDGDLLVQVTYMEADVREPLSGKHALRGAYAAAQEVAQALSAR